MVSLRGSQRVATVTALLLCLQGCRGSNDDATDATDRATQTESSSNSGGTSATIDPIDSVAATTRSTRLHDRVDRNQTTTAAAPNTVAPVSATPTTSPTDPPPAPTSAAPDPVPETTEPVAAPVQPPPTDPAWIEETASGPPQVPAAGTLLTATCGSTNSPPFDLLDFHVSSDGNSLLFSARYAPIEAGHNVWIGFTANGSPTRVVGELFETGSGVGQLQELDTFDTIYLEEPHDIGLDHVVLVVPGALAEPGIASAPLTVELKVDGPTVETCTSP
jgi:hypothetical protein